MSSASSSICYWCKVLHRERFCPRCTNRCDHRGRVPEAQGKIYGTFKGDCEPFLDPAKRICGGFRPAQPDSPFALVGCTNICLNGDTFCPACFFRTQRRLTSKL